MKMQECDGRRSSFEGKASAPDGIFTVELGDFAYLPRVIIDVEQWTMPRDSEILITFDNVPYFVNVEYDSSGVRLIPGDSAPIVGRRSGKHGRNGYSVQTDGGAFVGGNINTGGGAFVGRDYRASVNGGGAIAQGPGSVAVGLGGVAVGGNCDGSVDTSPRSATVGTIDITICLKGTVRVVQRGVATLQGISATGVTEMRAAMV